MRAMSPPPAATAPEDRRAHLAQLTAAIGRMSTLGFAVKAWGITLSAGLFVLGRPGARIEVGVVALAAVAILWGLDAHLMRVERAFRLHYERVRRGEAPADFAMEPATLRAAPIGLLTAMTRQSGFLTAFWTLLLTLVVLGAALLRWVVAGEP